MLLTELVLLTGIDHFCIVLFSADRDNFCIVLFSANRVIVADRD